MLAGLVLPLVAGCGGGEEPAEGPPLVVASIFPVAELAREVGGADVRVRVLLPSGASPATFEPTPRSVREVRGARVFLLLGASLDPWASELMAGASGTRVVPLLEGLELQAEDETGGTGNPHVWLDPVRTRDELLPRIADALAGAVPEAAERIRERTGTVKDTLTALDREIRAALTPLERRAFVASHPAWVYYAARYGLRQVGVVHGHPGQEPSARGLAGLVEDARDADVRVVFSEPQVPDAAARALAAELGVPVLALDPLGGPGLDRRDTYPGLMRYNTAQFVRGLSGDSGPGPSAALPPTAATGRPPPLPVRFRKNEENPNP